MFPPPHSAAPRGAQGCRQLHSKAPLCSMHLPGAAAQRGGKKKKGNTAEALIKGFSSTSSLAFTVPELLCIHQNAPRAKSPAPQPWLCITLEHKEGWEAPGLVGRVPLGLWTNDSHFPQPSFLLPQPAVQRGVCQTSSFICPFSFSIRHLPAFPNVIVPFFASQIVKITQTAKLAPCL